MKKYFAVVRITFANILQYRWEFMIVQLRTAIILLTLYFLWTQIYSTRLSLFGFDKSQIISYIFLASIVRQITIASAADQIAGELQSWGKFFSYLLRPIGYFRYWFTVDLVYKISGTITFLIIAYLLAKILDISLITPSSFSQIFLSVLSIFVAFLIYFYGVILISSAGFWTSQVWGLQFFILLVVEFSAGVFFPIDVLPKGLQTIINLSPFPYLLYYPVNIFLGRLSLDQSILAIIIATFWLVVVYFLSKIVWYKGLKSYEAWGG